MTEETQSKITELRNKKYVFIVGRTLGLGLNSVCLPCFSVSPMHFEEAKLAIDKLFPKNFATEWDPNKKGVLLVKKLPNTEP